MKTTTVRRITDKQYSITQGTVVGINHEGKAVTQITFQELYESSEATMKALENLGCDRHEIDVAFIDMNEQLNTVCHFGSQNKFLFSKGPEIVLWC